MTPPIFVISLPGSKDRQDAIAAQLNQRGLSFSWIDGVDGRRLDENALREVYSAERAKREGGRLLSKGEVGCALSHLRIYQTMLDLNHELALVLEDDAALSKDFEKELALICSTVDWNDNEIVLLSHIQKYTEWGSLPVSKKSRLVSPLTAYNGNGYLITQRGATKLLAELRPVYQPADCWNYLRKKRIVRIRGIVPYLVNHSRLSEESLIGQELRTQQAPPQKNSPHRVLKRFLYDKFIYQLLVKPILRIRKQKTPW